MSLGSMTHSVDMNQRYVELEILSVTPNGSGHDVEARAPSDAVVAQPGYYMLFVLDGKRIPSEARIVELH